MVQKFRPRWPERLSHRLRLKALKVEPCLSRSVRKMVEPLAPRVHTQFLLNTAIQTHGYTKRLVTGLTSHADGLGEHAGDHLPRGALCQAAHTPLLHQVLRPHHVLLLHHLLLREAG